MPTSISTLQLSAMRALLGEITPEVRAIVLTVDAQCVTLRVFHEGAASAELTESMNVVDTEILADYPASGPDAITLATLLVRSDAPERIPRLGTPIFARKGVQFA